MEDVILETLKSTLLKFHKKKMLIYLNLNLHYIFYGWR